MFNKYFLFCALFISGVNCDCDGYFECFNTFFKDFFVGDPPNTEYVNVSSKHLPDNFVEVKGVGVGDLDRVLAEISSFIQQDITDKLKTESDATFSNVSPNTKIYIKTFNYNVGDVKLEDLDRTTDKTVDEGNIVSITNKTLSNENKSLLSTETPLKKNNVTKQSSHKHISDNIIPKSDDISYYDSVEDNSTDYPVIDYVDLYKDVTNEENVYEATEVPGGIKDQIQMSMDEYVVGLENIIWDINNNSDAINTTDVSDVYPWIATIFIKNNSKSNQFEYYCDGALLNEKLLITAARCVNINHITVDPQDILVMLGKTSLAIMNDKEKAVKVKQIIIHENFTNEAIIENDLALLVLEEPVKYNVAIQPASVGNDTQDVDKLVTTAWDLQGDIVPVLLDDKENKACNEEVGKNMFCATFGKDVALCPSYGGVFAAKQGTSWNLYGMRSADASDRGLCFDKHIWFTDLRKYSDWIREHLE